MDQKRFISSFFGIFCFLNFSDFFHVASYTLSNSDSSYNDIDSNILESHRNQFPVLQENFQNNFKEANGIAIEQPSGKDADENKRWLNVLTFDKLCNLTEKDKGTGNETKNIFINTEEHLRIFENGDEEEEEEDKLKNQLQEEEKNIFHLLSPEGFLSQIISQDQSRGLERTKRQAEDGKRRCRCRRKRRRGMSRRRRRRRRNRMGQQRRRRRRGGRRRNGRRGRRRCVCRKKGDGEGKSDDGEEPEVEEADGEEEGTTEGGEEATTEEDGEEEEEEEEEEGDGGEGGEEGSEEESNEGEDDEEDDEGGSSTSEGEMPSLNNIPTYVFPYPNMVETPIAMMPIGVPIGSYSRSTIMNKIPSYLAAGTLLSENRNSNAKE